MQELTSWHRGSVITLDGSRSFSAEANVPLTYQWSFISLPSGMGSLLSDPKSVNPTFTLKRQGRCEIQLVVKDSLGMQVSLIPLSSAQRMLRRLPMQGMTNQ